MVFRSLAAAALGVALMGQSGVFRPHPPMKCSSCDEWNAVREPFRVFGNTSFVGTAGLGAGLITSKDGHILLDGGLPQTAESIDRSVRALGFKTADIKLILNSHAHYDHAGGIAAIQRASGATVASSPSGAQALERGEPTDDDPQFAFGRAANAYPRVSKVRVVADGETLRVGELAIVAHFTPGHTPGSTTWTWRSCEGERCVNLVYADSLNAVSAPSFRFTDHKERLAAFRKSIATVANLPCDIILTVHPETSGLGDKFRRRGDKPAVDPFIDPEGCWKYAAAATTTLDKRLAEEKAVK
nr:L1_beta_lactamase [uncultured bacterium]